MIAVLQAVGLIVATGLISYWLLGGDTPAEERWAQYRRRAMRERDKPQHTAQSIMMRRVFGTFGEAEILGLVNPQPPREIYRAETGREVPLVLLEKAAHMVERNSGFMVVDLPDIPSDLPEMTRRQPAA